MLHSSRLASVFLVALFPVALVLTPANSAPPGGQELAQGLLHGDAAAVRAYLRAGGNSNLALAGQLDCPVTPLLAAVWLDRDLAHLLLAESRDLNTRTTFHGYSAFDIAVHLYGESDALTRRLAMETVRVRPPADLEQAAWVANAVAVLGTGREQGTTLGLSYIVAAYQPGSGTRAAREEVLRRAELLRDECRQRTPCGCETCRLPPHLADMILPALGKSADAALTQKFAAALLRRGDLPCAEDAVCAQFRQELLETVHRQAKTDPEGTGWVMTRFVGPLLQAAVGEPAEVLFQRHPARFKVLTDLLKGRAVQAIDKPELLQSWTSLLQGVRAAPADASAQRAHFASCEASLYLLQTVAGQRHPRLARQLQAVGLAALQITRLAVRVGGITASVSSQFTVAGGVASAVMLLASAADGGLGEPAVQKQVAELAGHVEDVRRQLGSMDRQLDRIYRDLSGGLRRLANDVALVREELRGVGLRLSLLESQMQSLAPDLRGYVETAADRALGRDLSQCLNRDRADGEPLTVGEFSRCLNALRQAATDEARDPLARGRTPTAADLADDASFAVRLASLAGDGLDGNIALLQAAAGRIGRDGGFGRRALVNPVRWALYADLYVQLASRYPEYFYRHCSDNGLDQMLEAGRDWQEALNGLPSGFHLRLLSNYRDRAEHLRQVIRKKAGWLPRSREQTERDLQADATVADALRQVTAARVLLQAFVSLSMSRTLAGNRDWQQLLGGEDSLPDGAALLARGLVDTGRTAAWHEQPGRKIEALLRDQGGRPEPLPLIETTMQRLQALRQLHQAGRPEMSLSQAVTELRQAVQTIARE